MSKLFDLLNYGALFINLTHFYSLLDFMTEMDRREEEAK